MKMITLFPILRSLLLCSMFSFAVLSFQPFQPIPPRIEQQQQRQRQRQQPSPLLYVMGLFQNEENNVNVDCSSCSTTSAPYCKKFTSVIVPFVILASSSSSLAFPTTVLAVDSSSSSSSSVVANNNHDSIFNPIYRDGGGCRRTTILEKVNSNNRKTFRHVLDRDNNRIFDDDDGIQLLQKIKTKTKKKSFISIDDIIYDEGVLGGSPSSNMSPSSTTTTTNLLVGYEDQYDDDGNKKTATVQAGEFITFAYVGLSTLAGVYGVYNTSLQKNKKKEEKEKS